MPAPSVFCFCIVVSVVCEFICPVNMISRKSLGGNFTEFATFVNKDGPIRFQGQWYYQSREMWWKTILGPLFCDCGLCWFGWVVAVLKFWASWRQGVGGQGYHQNRYGQKRWTSTHWRLVIEFCRIILFICLLLALSLDVGLWVYCWDCDIWQVPDAGFRSWRRVLIHFLVGWLKPGLSFIMFSFA